MFYDFVCLTWFDITTLTLTFSTLVIVQLLNAAFDNNSKTTTAILATKAISTEASNAVVLASTKSDITTTTIIPTTLKKTHGNGKIVEKQKSLQRDDSAYSTMTATAKILAAHNYVSFDSSCIPTPPPLPTSSPPTTTASTSANGTPTASTPSTTPSTPIIRWASVETPISIVLKNHANTNNTISSLTSATSTATLSDEYQEDEDTLSLENLFPCDQSEIYASRKISYIIDELIQTEQNYVNNLRKGLQMYGRLHERQDLPDSLLGKERRLDLLGNIEEILALHERQVLPMMLRNQHDLKLLFDEFAAFFNKNHFYCYVIYAINEKTSMRLRHGQREWFQNLQNEINDRLGVDSFLVQPIQRLTRYPLLLQQFISEFYKSGISCKPVLMSVCKLETRMRRCLEVVNQAQEISNIEDVNEPSLLTRGQFRKSTEFDAYHHRSRKKYRAKVFLFDHCVLCTEVRKRRLVYRHHYDWAAVELQPNHLKSLTLLLKTQPNGTVVSTFTASQAEASVGTPAASASNGTETPATAANGSKAVAKAALYTLKEEYEFNANEATTVKNWLHTARSILERARVDAAQRGKFSLPMDLVLGVLLAIWLIWLYL